MDDESQLSAIERRKRERRIWRAGLLLSLLAHLVLFFVWRAAPDPQSPFSAAGPDAGDDLAASGGMQSVTLVNPPTEPVTPPPIPVPDAVDIEPVEFDDEPTFDESALEGDVAGTDGPGVEEGEGEGDAGDSDRGTSDLVPPRPRGMIIPPSSDALRGKEVEVWVFVDVRGRVVPDSTVLRPPTGDRGLDRRLIEEAADWIFQPATRDGEPVATWYPYRISM